MIAASSALKSEETVWQSWRQITVDFNNVFSRGVRCRNNRAFHRRGRIRCFSATIPDLRSLLYLLTYMKNAEGAASQAEQARRHVEN
jgi:hypothetical protein